MKIDLSWHFVQEEIEDLPSNFTAPPQFQASSVPPLPQKDDLVSFVGLPGVKFMVSFREFEFSREPSQPISLHVHLVRLKLPKS